MNMCIKASPYSGLVGIWWIENNKVVGCAVPLDKGHDDGSVKSFPDHISPTINKRYGSLDGGRVSYNLRTQCYEVTCSDATFNDLDKRQLIVDTFQLAGCRYDFVNLGTQYHVS